MSRVELSPLDRAAIGIAAETVPSFATRRILRGILKRAALSCAARRGVGPTPLHSTPHIGDIANSIAKSAQAAHT